MSRPPSYITKHHGGGWKYQMAVPMKLRPIIGKKVFVEYIKPMTPRDALAKAREFAVRDAGKLAKARSTDPSQSKIEAAGGVQGIKKGHGPKKVRHIFGGVFEAAKQIEEAGETAVVAVLLSWDRLFDEWKKTRNPSHTRDQQATIRLLKKQFGDINCRHFTPHQAAEFRDAQSASGETTPYMVKARLGHLKAMFARAAQDPTSPFYGMPNPGTGVLVRGVEHVPVETLPFSPPQVRQLLDTAARIRFGDNEQKKRHREVMWALRLLAYTGCRPSEILQLQGGDVVAEHGVKFLRIQETDALTWQPHPRKSIKTDEDRVVPLHKDVLDFFDYAANFAKDAFIFSAFKWHKNGYRVKWFTNNFGELLEKAGVKPDNPTGRFVLYSLRHAFHDAMDRAEVPEKQQKRLVGHGKKSVHDRYGRADLVLLRGYVNKLKIVEQAGPEPAESGPVAKIGLGLNMPTDGTNTKELHMPTKKKPAKVAKPKAKKAKSPVKKAPKV